MTMATLVRIDELYINLDQVTRIEVDPPRERVLVYFAAAADGETGGWIDMIEVKDENGARLLKWLDAGGRVSEA
jgi:hypothetical protein